MKYTTLTYLLIILVACNQETNRNESIRNNFYDQFSELERDSIAKNYNDFANYFLQPSYAYRIYKDSANQAQPNELSYLQTLSYSYKKRGEHLNAMALLNKVVNRDIEKQSVDALQYRAWTLLYYYRDYQGALDDIIKIEKMSQDDYSQCWGEPCSFQKSQAYYMLGQFENAIETMQQLIEVEKLHFKEISNHMYYFYLARSYQKIGNSEAALKYFMRAIELYPEYCEAHFYLGELYKSLEQNEKARLAYQKAMKFQDYKMNEPYIERFDEVFPYQIKKRLAFN